MVSVLPNLIFLFVTLNFSHTDFVWESNYALIPPTDNIAQKSCQELNISVSDCIKIKPEDKKQLFLASVPEPNFLFVNSWNDKINFGKYPIGNAKSSGSIRDAWVKILPPSPSVYDNDSKKVFVPSTGKLKFAYAFSYVVPVDNSTECPNKYFPIGYNYNVEVFQDGKKISDGELKSINFQMPNQKSHFEAKVEIESAYLYDKYTFETQCDKDGCSKVCKFVDEYLIENSLNVSDPLDVEKSSLDANLSTFINRNQNGIWDILFTYNKSNNASFVFQSDFSTFFIRNFRYSLKSESAYNILQTEVKNIDEFSQQNFVLESIERKGDSTTIHGLMPSPESGKCKVIISSHFSSKVFDDACINEGLNSTLKLNITEIKNQTVYLTAKLTDAENQGISDNTITIQYLNNTYQNKTDLEGRVSFVIPYQKGYYLIESWSSYDSIHKTSKSTIVIPAQIDFYALIEDIVFFGTFFVFFAIIIRRWRPLYGK